MRASLVPFAIAGLLGLSSLAFIVYIRARAIWFPSWRQYRRWTLFAFVFVGLLVVGISIGLLWLFRR